MLDVLEVLGTKHSSHSACEPNSRASITCVIPYIQLAENCITVYACVQAYTLFVYM